MPKKGPSPDDATTLPAIGSLGNEVAVELVRRILQTHGGDLKVTIHCTRCGEQVECSLSTPDMKLVVHRLASPCPTAN